ncbi:unnamed protein product [Arctia plantaginis]|nr:unnamed protein product [Arctia plantaginis]
MTAGHCAQKVDPSTVVLRAGSSFRGNGTVIPVSKVTPHPQYDDPAFDKDVAVIKTTNPIEFNDVIKPIKLPPKGRPMEAKSKILVSGWGKAKGDSGGAATQDGMAVGIVSFGRGCAYPFSPSVFADIAAPAIRDFITEQTGL